MTFAVFASLLLLLLAGFGGVAAQESVEDAPQPEATSVQKDGQRSVKDPEVPNVLSGLNGPLVVPVFPRGFKNKDLPASTDLRDSYIMMEDGSALSVADWILGGLTKNDTGAGMSDYQNRLFLGQVARAMVGMDEKLVNHSFIYTRPTVSFRPPPKPGQAMQTLQTIVGAVAGVILPGTPEGWHPAKTGGAFSQLQQSGGDAAILFEGQFSGAMLHSVQDIRDTGVYQIMLDEQKAKLAAEQKD